MLSYAENFQRQFRQLYGDRKTLFLRPANECGVEVDRRPQRVPQCVWASSVQRSGMKQLQPRVGIYSTGFQVKRPSNHAEYSYH